jgi:hypothetical protein
MSGKDICRSTSLVITLLAAKYSTIIILISSVADLWYFDADPDPRIHACD